MSALKLYASQLKIEGGPISVKGMEAHARMRGIHAGVEAAEAHVMRRFII